MLGSILALAIAATALAWYPSNAAAYADSWWHVYNPTYEQWPQDCANFVSQAVFAGGYPMNASTNNPWYANYGYADLYSKSWTLVQYNHGFFLTDGGSVVASYYGIRQAYPTLGVGDIVYYAFQNDHTFATNSHESIVTVSYGTATTTGDHGSLVDAHTNDRYHEFWTLYRWNADWPTTYYEIVRVNQSR